MDKGQWANFGQDARVKTLLFFPRTSWDV